MVKIDVSVAQVSEGDVTKTGWLVKEGGRMRTWHKRYFVLLGRTVYYFESDNVNAKAKGMVHVDESVELAPIEVQGHPNCLMIGTESREYRMQAESEKEMKAWISTLKKASKGDDVPVIGAARRAGWLEAQDKKKWKKRFVVITDTQMFVYEKEPFSSKSAKPKEQIELADEVEVAAATVEGKDNCFSVKTAAGTTVYHVEEEEEFSAWLRAFNAVLLPPGKGDSHSVEALMAEEPTRASAVLSPGRFRKWAKRHAVLVGKKLYVFTSATATRPKHVFELGLESDIQTDNSDASHPHTLRLRGNHDSRLVISFETEDEADEWLRVLRRTATGKTAANRGAFAMRNADPRKMGTLKKLGGFVPNWKTRFFILTDVELLYYTSENASAPQGSIPVGKETKAWALGEDGKKPNSVAVQSVFGKGREYVLSADTPEDAVAWEEVINKAAKNSKISLDVAPAEEASEDGPEAEEAKKEKKKGKKAKKGGDAEEAAAPEAAAEEEPKKEKKKKGKKGGDAEEGAAPEAAAEAEEAKKEKKKKKSKKGGDAEEAAE